MGPGSIPAIWLVQDDAELRAHWADALREDGMAVREFGDLHAALGDLKGSSPPAVLVVDPGAAPLTVLELVEQIRDAAPQAQVVLTPCGGLSDPHTSEGLPVLNQPFHGVKLSRYIRLVAAKPALRGTLQARFREARRGLLGAAA